MVYKCIVTNCRGNYDINSKVSVFSIPTTEPLRSKWLRAIPRSFVPSKYSKVCEKHFLKEEIQRKTSVFDEKRGIMLTTDLAMPRLMEDVVPSIFPGCPSYLSGNVFHREGPEVKKTRMENQMLQQALSESIREEEERTNKVKVDTFNELCDKISDISVPNNWMFKLSETSVYFFRLEMQEGPKVVASVVVEKDLMFSTHIFSDKVNLNIPTIDIIKSLNDLEYIIKTLDTAWLNLNINPLSTQILYLVIKCLEENLADENSDRNLFFILEQLKLFHVKNRAQRYSPEMLVFCTLLFSISPHAYRFIMSSQILTIPHPSTLHRLTSKYTLNPKVEQCDNGFLSYINAKRPLLKDNDLQVVLMMDEIHIKPYFDFKGGSIFGASFNSVNAASTAYVFMIQGIRSTFKDVVHILPVCKITANELFTFIHKIIINLEITGFKVICVVSDNNAINRKAMSFFSSPPGLSIVYPHPANSSRPLFFALDSVHILKCIRNNWINQKNDGQSFYYPNFKSPDTSRNNLCTASFNALKELHRHESDEALIKFGFGLTFKALNPSSLERQNVKLALKVFSNFIPEALREIGGTTNLPNSNSTAEFIEIISRWFDILNVKNPFVGRRLNNVYKFPLTDSKEDERMKFLKEFLLWVDTWKELDTDNGKLTKETNLALSHTTHAIIELVKYCSRELQFEYILPGKIQTDTLEERFGRYHQLSGANYNVSITQIFESESKLRMQDFVPLALHSSKFGSFEVAEFNEEDFDDNNDGLPLESALLLIYITPEDLQSLDILPIIVYLAGYSVFKYLRRYPCIHCSEILSVNKTLNLDISYRYIRNLDRGGLLCPSQDVIQVIGVNYLVIKKLISNEFENHFLRVRNQRQAVVELTYLKILDLEFITIDQCVEGHNVEKIYKYVLRASTNTFLNNYCSKANDIKKVSNNQRKLQTLVKPTVSFM